MSNAAGIVIVGAGHAGVETADALRHEGYAGSITLIGDGNEMPYQRPPLSKDFLHTQATSTSEGDDAIPAGEASQVALPLRGASFYKSNDIDLLTGVTVTALNRSARSVNLSTGQILNYEHLVLATGARGRQLRCEGAELNGVLSIRSLDDADEIAQRLVGAKNVVVIGAGFIGLEFAAGVAQNGISVTVLEYAPHPLMRALSPAMSRYIESAIPQLGVDLRCGVSVASLVGEDSPEGKRVTGVSVSMGENDVQSILPADLVIVGIGIEPNDGLALDAGLSVDNGIVVDEQLLTSDTAISALGDCANFPSIHSGGRLRLESVQNATDQARFLAKRIMGSTSRYSDTPWFWSHQGPLRLSIVGLNRPGLETILLGDEERGKFSLFAFDRDELVVVESLNSPADHMAARRLFPAGILPTRQEVMADGFTLKSFASNVLPSTTRAGAATLAS